MKNMVSVSYDFPKMLKHLVGGKAKDWTELDGMDSGVGLDYFYSHDTLGEVYINIDQNYMSISRTDPITEEEEGIWSGEIEDEEVKKFVKIR